jgi:small subunit ribosomal protein S17
VSATKAKSTKAKAASKPRQAAPAAAAPAAEAAAAAAAIADAPVAPQAQPAAAEAKGARTLTGRVVSHKMQKTIAVEIERLIRHPTYGKYIRRTTKLLAHDESGTSREGDLVIITPCRPMSRRKSWRLLQVVTKAAAR